MRVGAVDICSFMMDSLSQVIIGSFLSRCCVRCAFVRVVMFSLLM